MYGKTWEDVCAVVSENCSINNAMGSKLDFRFVGCSIHRFNLVVQGKILDDDEIVQKVNELMRKFKYLIPAARLRKLTPLCAITKNDTRWSSVHALLTIYFEIRYFIKEIASIDL